jgi:tRNA (guanine-N7-)-methyltransferase
MEENSVDEVHLYHPQPYYDETEVHFGMLTCSFVKRIWKILKPSGTFYVQTDNKAYGKYILSVLHPLFYCEAREGGWPDAPEGRTRREAYAIRKKLKILRIVASPREMPLEAPFPEPYFQKPGLRRRRLPHKKRREGRP